METGVDGGARRGAVTLPTEGTADGDLLTIVDRSVDYSR